MGNANSGRKTLPFVVKQAKGTARPEREKKTYTPSSKQPLPPAWLNRRAKQIFRHFINHRLKELKMDSRSHTEIIALYAARSEELERFDKLLSEKGYTYEITLSTGQPTKANPNPPLVTRMVERPEVKLREKAAIHVHRLLVEFGLSPASAQKVGVVKDKGKKNSEFDGF